MRKVRVVPFMILLAVFLTVDFYAFQGFKELIKKASSTNRAWLSAVYWIIPIGLWATVFSMFVFSDSPEKNKAFMWSMTFLIGFFIAKVFWIVFLLIDDIIRGIKYAAGTEKKEGANVITRSKFIVSAGAILAGTVFSTMVFGIFKGAHNYKVRRRVLKLKNLPQEFVGTTIAQISDVHSGSFWSKSEVSKGIDLIMEQNADLVFFTGDLVNNTADEFDEYKEIFGRIQAPLGVFSVLGNHDYGDYYSWPREDGMTKEGNLNALIQHHKDMKWDVLLNENRIVEKNGAKLAILGVENISAKRHFKNYGDLAEAYRGVEDIDTKLLLSHDPSHWKDEVLKFTNIDATFSGHTHGMQFGIDTKHYKWSPVKFMYKEWADLYKEGDQYLYVNRGFGYLGYPGRIGFYPEITVFELQSHS